MWSLNASQQPHLVLTHRSSVPSDTEGKTGYVGLTERWHVNLQADLLDPHYSWILRLWIHLWVHIYMHPQINIGASPLIHRHAPNGENSEFPSWSQTMKHFVFLLSYCKQVSLCGQFSAMIVCFFCVCVIVCLLLVILLFKMAPSTVWSGVSVCKRAVTCLLEKICVLYELPSGPSWSAIGHEFNVNDSTMYIKHSVFEQI